MAKKKPAFNLPSTEKGAAAPATDWVYKSEAEGKAETAKPVSKAAARKAVVTEVTDASEPMPPTQNVTVTPDGIVKTFAGLAAAAGLIPMPLLDVVAITGVQVKMIHALADHYQLEFNEQIAKSLIASLAVSAGTTGFAYGAGRSIMKSIPFVGQIASIATMPAAAYGATYAIGELFSKHFANGGTLFNMKPAPAAA